MARIVEVSDEDLRRAWRACGPAGASFDSSMKDPAMSVAIRCCAKSLIRRQQRLLAQQQHDFKRAQANDIQKNEQDYS